MAAKRASMTDEQVAAINQQLASDPQWQQLFLAYQRASDRDIFGQGPEAAALKAYATERYGIPMDVNHVNLDSQGRLINQHPTKEFWKTAAKSAAIAGAGAYASGALAGSGGGAGAAAPAATSGGVGIGETGAVTGLGGSGFGGAAAGGTAAASGGSTAGSIGSTVAKTGGFGWKDLLPTLIGAGTSIGGAAIGAHGQTEAAKIQAESADKALAYQKEMFERQQADLAPYREVGQSSMRQLAFGTGLPVPDMPAKQPPPVAQAPAPGAVPRQPTQMVSVQSPSGQVGQIPASQLQAALQAGGKQVQ